MAFENIFEVASLVQGRTRCWDGTVTMRPEDLGLEKDTLPPGTKLGYKSLVPLDDIKPVLTKDRSARKILEEQGFHWPWGKGRLVFHSNMPRVIEMFEEHRESYDLLVEEFLDKYDTFKLKMRPVWVHAATQAHWRTVSKNKPSNVFISDFLNRIHEEYPTKEEMRSKYSLSYLISKTIPVDVSQFGLDGASYALQNTEYLKEELHDMGRVVCSKLAPSFTRFAKSLREDRKMMTPKILTAPGHHIDRYTGIAFFEDEESFEILRSFKSEYLDGLTQKNTQYDLNKRLTLADRLDSLAATFGDESLNRAKVDKYIRSLGI